MNTAKHVPVSRETRTLIHRLIVGLLLGAVLTPLPTPVGADDSFQQNTLFNPSRGQLKVEARGRVMIYDGLDSETVERALDTQFERIENMMFVRIHRKETDDDGTEEPVDDDGC